MGLHSEALPHIGAPGLCFVRRPVADRYFFHTPQPTFSPTKSTKSLRVTSGANQ
jgi:hypothetical protein